MANSQSRSCIVPDIVHTPTFAVLSQAGFYFLERRSSSYEEEETTVRLYRAVYAQTQASVYINSSFFLPRHHPTKLLMPFVLQFSYPPEAMEQMPDRVGLALPSVNNKSKRTISISTCR